MTDSRKWFLFASLLAVVALLYLLAPVLTPFLIAILFAYVGAPVVQRLEGWHIPRVLAVVIVFLAVCLLLAALPLVLFPLAERQIVLLFERMPGYIIWLQQTVLPWVQGLIGQLDGSQGSGQDAGIDMDTMKQALEDYGIGGGAVQKVGGLVAGLVATISRSGLALIGWAGSVLIVLVVAFYLLRDWKQVIAYCRALLPRPAEQRVVKIIQECDEVLGSFLRGQLSVMACLAIIYTTGLWIAGSDFALLIGVIAGVVSFVPYLGLIVGLLVAGLASIVQFHDVSHLWTVIVVFGVGQVLESMVLTPLLVGDRLGLHPVIVIFSVMAGGQLFGFFGMLLALPMAAISIVLIRHAYASYNEQAAEQVG